MKKDMGYCFWSHSHACDETKHLCCHFCKDKKCEWRCVDEVASCRYFTKEEETLTDIVAVQAQQKNKIAANRIEVPIALKENLKSYKENNKYTLQNLAKLIDVPANLIQRIITKDKIHMRVDTKNYNKIKLFLEGKN